MWYRNAVVRWLPSLTPQLWFVADAWKKSEMFRYDDVRAMYVFGGDKV